MDVIDLRSDTETLPSEAMLEAMRTAELGDDILKEDPTVNKLEAMAAELLGTEAAMLVISGTMGNLVCLMAHTNRGEEVIIDPESHIFYYEAGSMAGVAGLMPMPVASRNGILDPADIAAAVRKPNQHFPRPRLLCLENTHNRGGGTVTPLDLHKQLCQVAHQNNLKVHLDGARLFNAAIAENVSASAFVAEVDSVMFCLSKGLSCPLGSIIAGSKKFIEKANYCRKRIGGGMRQAGIIAAAGIIALEQMIDRLAEDHLCAKLLAEGLNEIPGFSVNKKLVQTNMVYADHSKLGIDTMQVIERLKKAGVLVSARPPVYIRFVTHRHHNKAIIEEALARIKSVVTK